MLKFVVSELRTFEGQTAQNIALQTRDKLSSLHVISVLWVEFQKIIVSLSSSIYLHGLVL